MAQNVYGYRHKLTRVKLCDPSLTCATHKRLRDAMHQYYKALYKSPV